MAKLGRMLLVCFVAAGALTAGVLTAPPSGASSSVTGVVVVSSPGDPVGEGSTHVFTPSSATFNASGGFGGVEVLLFNMTSLWRFEFDPPIGSQLMPGQYGNVVNPQFRGAHPGLDVVGSGGSCGTPYGSFVVNSVQVDATGFMTELDASFVLHCDSPTAPPLTGIVKYNAPSAAPLLLDATQPSTVVGERTAFSARVAPNGTPPTGNVSFLDGTTVLGTAPLKAGGIAVFTTSKLAGGAHSITARYSGDASHPSTTSLPATQRVSTATTSYWFLSTSGEFVGAGAQASYAPATATIALTGALAGFHMTVSTQLDDWSINLAPASGQQLQPGTYANAQLSADLTHPEVDVSNGGRACNTGTGAFNISAITTNASGNITSLTASFVQRCGGSTVPPLVGVIRWNAS